MPTPTIITAAGASTGIATIYCRFSTIVPDQRPRPGSTQANQRPDVPGSPSGLADPGGSQILLSVRGDDDLTAIFESSHAFADRKRVESVMAKCADGWLGHYGRKAGWLPTRRCARMV